jgi:N-acetylglucosaminyldiphosphoundecaprenol N-acetyl-beta-D-mannosaminyltransferase
VTYATEILQTECELAPGAPAEHSSAPAEHSAAPAAHLAALALGDPIRLGAASIHPVDEPGAIGHVIRQLQAGRGGWVVTHNLDHLRRLERDAAFAALCRSASLRVADGMPLVWASRIQGQRLPGRVAGSSLINTLSAAAAEVGMSIYLLGGNPGTAERAGEILAQRYRGLRLAGAACPAVGFEADAAYVERLKRELIAAAPDIVYVGLGSPKQERLIAELAPLLPEAWFLGVGISFSFVCGEVIRAPRWVQRAGLEWLHRLIQEPGRLFRRYLIQGLPFAARLMISALRRRVLPPRGSRGE